MEKYSIDYTVGPEDIDELNHVNNIRYLEWVQEISKDHWFSKINGKLPLDKYLWVVANHNLDYFRPAFLNDRLRIETFVKDFDGKFSNRVVKVINASTDKLLFQSLTKWCLIDVKSQNTIDVPQEIASIFGF